MRRLRFHHWPILICTAAIALALAACSPATAEPTTTPTGTPTAFHTPQPTATATAVPTATPTPLPTATPTLTPSPTPTLHPLTIAAMRLREYPGSPLTIEQTLDAGANYRRYIASYRSDGLKINGLLTVPDGDRPATGWPVIVFIHGYIPPEQYRTTERYVAYVDGFARNGYIVFKVDLRGHGSSEGNAQGAYGSTDYTVDVLNAVAALRQYPDADPARFGMWGHSMGGYLTLNAMVITRDIRAGVVWAGMVVSPADLLERWRTPTPGPSPTPPPDGTPGRPARLARTARAVRETRGQPGILGRDLGEQLPRRPIGAAATASQHHGRDRAILVLGEPDPGAHGRRPVRGVLHLRRGQPQPVREFRHGHGAVGGVLR